MPKLRKVYFRVEVFALGDLGGGSWEEDVMFSDRDPQQAYNKALAHLLSIGYAFSAQIEQCDKKGENLA